MGEKELRILVGEAWKGEYDSSSTYGNANVVQDPSGLSVYRSLQSNNRGHALTDTDWWFCIIDLSAIKDESERIAALGKAIEDWYARHGDLCNIQEVNDFVVDIVLKDGVDNPQSENYIDFSSVTNVLYYCSRYVSSENKYRNALMVYVGDAWVSLFIKEYDTLAQAKADLGVLLEGQRCYVVLRDAGEYSGTFYGALLFNRVVTWSSLNEHPVIKVLMMEQDVNAIQIDMANINDTLVPITLSGTSSAWTDFWDDENNPVLQGSLIENNSDMPVLAFDSYSTVQGEYHYIRIPVGKSWTAEYPVYRLRAADNGGNYSVKIYYPGNLVTQVKDLDAEVSAGFASLNGKVDGINNTLYGGSEELSTVVEQANAGIPPRFDGSHVRAGFFRNYTVDLTGAYARGYKKVRFYAVSYTATGNVVPGLVATGIEDGAWIVESYIPLVSYQAGYWELPLTGNSSLLVACLLTAQGKSYIGDKYPEGTDLDFVPTTVQLLNEAGTGVVVKVSELDQRVTALEGGSAAEKFPATYMPKKVYGVIGDTLQIFRRCVVVSNDPYRQYLDFVCGQGKVYERYLEVTPEKVSGDVPANLTIKHRLIADDFSKSEEQTSSLVLADRPSKSPAKNINVLCIGSSTTESGQWPSELKRRLTGTRDNGTPAADGLSNVAFVGRKALLAASGVRPVAVNVEATGGWTWKMFYTPQDAVRFQVSGVTIADIGTVYSYTNGNGLLVKVAVAEVNITSGSGNIRFVYTSDTVGTGVPADASGTITRVSSSGGDATIAYSGAEDKTYCPFYDETTELPDFAHYASQYCNNQIDVLVAYMGNVNEEIYGNSTDARINTVLNDMKTLIDAFHADFPNGKVIIGIAALPNPWYGYEYNYSAASNIKSWSMRYGLYRYAKAVETFLRGDDYNGWCFFACTHTEVDSENCYPTTTKPANTRTSKTDTIGINGAHPTLNGYQMIADSFYRAFACCILTGTEGGDEPPTEGWKFGDSFPVTFGGVSGDNWQLGEELPAILSD